MLIKVSLFCAPFCLSSCVQMQLSFQPIGEQKRGVYVPFGKKKTTRKDNTMTMMMRRVLRGGKRGGVLAPGFLSWGGARCSQNSFVGGLWEYLRRLRLGEEEEYFYERSHLRLRLNLYGRSSLNSSADERKKSLVIVESPAKAKRLKTISVRTTACCDERTRERLGEQRRELDLTTTSR